MMVTPCICDPSQPPYQISRFYLGHLLHKYVLLEDSMLLLLSDIFFFRLRKIDWGQICCIGGRIWGTLGVKLREWVASFIGFTFNLKHKPHFVCVVLGIIDYLRSLVWEVHPEEEIKLNEFVEVLLWRRVYTYQRMLEELS